MVFLRSWNHKMKIRAGSKFRNFALGNPKLIIEYRRLIHLTWTRYNSGIMSPVAWWSVPHFGNFEADNRARSCRIGTITLPPLSGLVFQDPFVSIELRTARPRTRTMTREMRDIAGPSITPRFSSDLSLPTFNSHPCPGFIINYDRFQRSPGVFGEIWLSSVFLLTRLAAGKNNNN